MSFWKVEYSTLDETKEVLVEAIDKDTEYVENILREVNPDWIEFKVTPTERPDWVKHSMEDWEK